MKVYELRSILEDVEDQEAEVVIYADERGSEIITEVDIDVYESPYDDEFEEDEDRIKDGTVVIMPTEFAD